MVWVRLPVYFYKRNDTFYFSRSIPSYLQHRFEKRKIEVSLRTKSKSKAANSAAALSDRLERYWDSLRMEMIHLGDLDLSLAPETKRWPSSDFNLTDALPLYHWWHIYRFFWWYHVDQWCRFHVGFPERDIGIICVNKITIDPASRYKNDWLFITCWLNTRNCRILQKIISIEF